MSEFAGEIAAGSGRSREFLSVRIGDQCFALDIMSVREIRGWTSSTPLPHAPATVKGMINLRGAVMAIVDLAACLGLASEATSASSVVVVVECGARVAGLLVDAVCDILTVTDVAVQPLPDVGRGSSDALYGVMNIDGEIVGLLAIDNLLPGAALAA